MAASQRHPVVVVGTLIGFFLWAKGALTIVAAEVYFDCLEFFTRLLWDSKVVLAAERSIEDLFLAQGILNLSLGVSCLTAGYLNDVQFFTTHFLAFCISSILMHAWLLSSTGAMKTTSMHLIVHVIELSLVVGILMFFNFKNYLFSGGSTKVSDEKKMD